MNRYGALGEPVPEHLEPPDYGDYEDDENYLDNIVEDYLDKMKDEEERE